MSKKLIVKKDVMQERMDGWGNVLTGLGQMGRDRKEYTTFAQDFRLPETLCRNLYTYSGLAQRIVTLPVHDGLRKGFTIEGDKDNLIQNEFKRIMGGGPESNAMMELYRSWRWSRVYGGSLMVVYANDGRFLDEPLDENNIRDIEKVEAFQRWQCSRLSYYLDRTKPNYGNTEMFLITPRKPFSISFKIHESRCLVFDGVDVAQEIRVANQMWGDSVYQAIYERLRGMGESFKNIEHIIGEFILFITKIKGLAQKLAMGGEKELVERIMMNSMLRHVMGTYAIDSEGEDATRQSATTTGLGELMEKIMMAISAETGIPVRKLFGSPISGAGLSNNGDAETRDYYDNVVAERDTKVSAPLQRLIKLIMLQKQGAFHGTEIPNWKIVWPPLWEEPMSVQLANRKIMTDIDRSNWEMNVYDEDEIRESGYEESQSFDRVMKSRPKTAKPDKVELVTGDEEDANKPE